MCDHDARIPRVQSRARPPVHRLQGACTHDVTVPRATGRARPIAPHRRERRRVRSRYVASARAIGAGGASSRRVSRTDAGVH